MDRNATQTPGLTWGVIELAQFLGLQPQTIHDRLCRRPDSLPQRIRSSGKAPPRWLVDDVLAWARGEPRNAVHERKPMVYEVSRRGRPRKLAVRGAA